MGRKWAEKGHKAALVVLSTLAGYLIGRGSAQSTQSLRRGLKQSNQLTLQAMELAQKNARGQQNDETTGKRDESSTSSR